MVWKWLNQQAHIYFKEEAHQPKEQVSGKFYDQLSDETKSKVDDLLKVLSGAKPMLRIVPEVTQAEIDAIKIEDLEEREGRKSIAPIRPEWIIGDPCPNCGGSGMSEGVDSQGVPCDCHQCKGVGEINLVKVHADTIEEARKAYNITYGI
jgi:hypothetical protein